MIKDPVVTSITLEKEQSRFLDWFAVARNTSKSEIIRNLVEKLIKEESGLYSYYKLVDKMNRKEEK